MTPRKRIAQIGFITIGLPFAVFKLIFGLALPGLMPGHFGNIAGIALATLGAADMLVNILNSVFMAIRGRALTQVCVLSILLNRGGKGGVMFSADFGTALDVMLSFSLVAVVVGLNLMPRFSEHERMFWNFSVVTNVLGAGISRILVLVTPPQKSVGQD